MTTTVDAFEPLRLLSPDGVLADGAVPSLAGDALLDAWRAMLRSRVCDERCFSLQRQGRMGTFSPINGEEAAVVGSAWALDPSRDWVVPQYRELPAMLRQGYRLAQALQYYRGHPAGSRVDPGVHVLPYQISLAAQIPHAVGLAWGLRHQGLDGVVMTYFGDGASSEGDAHEALNLAGVRRAPVVFVLKNNGWAISTPVRKQTGAASFAARAAGYGIAGELVDGNDLFAMHDACSRAVARARVGEGPTLIEARTYRMGPHNTSDDPTRYVDPVELEERRLLDPVARVRRHLLGEGLIDEGGEQRLVSELRAEFDAAVAEAEAAAQPGADALFEHVYAEPPARLERQRADAAAPPRAVDSAGAAAAREERR
jgi:pyruvate dehydrogenase E1 component alpha subunit